MSVEIRGLEECVATLNRLQNFDRGALTLSVGEQIADAARFRVETSQVDPDGKPWAQQVVREGDPRPVFDGGSLLDSIRASARGEDAEVVVDVFQASFFERGTTRMVQRAILGPGRDDLPMIQKTAVDFFVDLIDE